MTHTYIQVIEQPTIHYLTRSVRRRAATSKRGNRVRRERRWSHNGGYTPDYEKLQNDLLSLSQNSKQIGAEKSGHFLIIDRPDVVIDAVRQVVESARSKSKL